MRLPRPLLHAVPPVRVGLLSMAVALGASLAACSASDAPSPSACEDVSKTAGVCPGQSKQSISQDMCSSTVSVEPASVAAALLVAKPGTCLVLGGGTYPRLDLPAGVHVLGKGGASSIIVQGLAVHGGGSVVGALTVKGSVDGTFGGSGAAGVRLEQVVVKDATGIAVNVLDLDVSLVDTTVQNGGEGGLAAVCGKRCTAGARPKVTLQRTLFDGNRKVALFVHGVDVTVDHVEIRKTVPRDFIWGRGVDLAGGSLSGTALVVVDGAECGMLAYDSAVDVDTLAVKRNAHFGVQLSKVTSGSIKNASLEKNGGIGMLADGSTGIIVQGLEVTDTQLLDFPTSAGGVARAGDGLNWRGNSNLTVKGARFANNGRQAIIVQGKNSGELADAKLEGTDASSGIIVQGLDGGGDSGIIVQGLTPKVATAGAELPLMAPLPIK